MSSLLSATVVVELDETLDFDATQTTVVSTHSEEDSQVDNHNSDEEIDLCDDDDQPLTLNAPIATKVVCFLVC